MIVAEKFRKHVLRAHELRIVVRNALQPRDMADLPSKFQLLAEHSADDKSFDLWIGNAGEPTPLAVTVVPDKEMRSVLRQAQQKLGQGESVFISREAAKQNGGEGKGSAAANGGGAAHSASRTDFFGDDQDRWTLDVERQLPAKDGESR